MRESVIYQDIQQSIHHHNQFFRTYATPIMLLRPERSVGKQSQRQGRLRRYRS